MEIRHGRPVEEGNKVLQETGRANGGWPLSGGLLEEVDPAHSEQSISLFLNCFKCPRKHLWTNSLNPWVELMVAMLPLPSLCLPELTEAGRCLRLGLGEGTGSCLCQAAGEEEW